MAKWIMKHRRAIGAAVASVAVVWLVGAQDPASAKVRLFRLQTQTAFLKGTLDGIGVDSLGTLRLADRVERLVEVGEPFVLSAAEHPAGWVIGTGNAGKILLIDRDGDVEVLHAADEPEIFALWVDDDGTVFAGSSPRGKVYRIRDGEAEVYFDPGEIYIWGLARAADGDLLVATGTEGRLFKVDSQRRGEPIFDSEDTHLRAIKTLSDGSVLLGTAGEGLILQLDPSGRPRTLHDAPYPEVVAFATDPSGNCYAALLASEASLVSLDRRTEQAESQEEATEDRQGTEDPAESEQVTVTVADTPQESAVGSRPPGFGGSRSEIVKITPQGAVETLATFKEQTVYALHWSRDRLWVGTGLDGKIFSLPDRRPVLEADLDERQIVEIVGDGSSPAFATANAAAFYRIAREPTRRGEYTSPALDAGQIARFGTLRWQGRVPEDGRLTFSYRSGMSASPDRTWTEWSAPAGGQEISLAPLASGRYFQWRAAFETNGGLSPTLSEVTVSYVQENLPPSIESFEVLEPGQVLVPANFNPSQQVFEPVSPNREGIFDTLEPASATDRAQRLKKLWKKGYRTLQWKTEDPNQDRLIHALSFRAEDTEGEWITVAEDIDQNHYSFDSTALPDGRYRFHLRVFDRSRLDDQDLKISEEISEPVVIDHSVPTLRRVASRGEVLEVEVEDLWNPIRSAEFSIDAAKWQPARVGDGLLDGQRETLLLPTPEEGSLMLLRVLDAAFNVVTFDVTRDRP